jgi:hypothetical protein
MKKFITRLLIFSVIFFLSEKLFLAFIIKAPELEADKRLEQLVKGEINKDIVIIGSSRGARNIIAGQIEDSLGLSCFNISYPGSDIEFHEFLLRTLFKFNKKPKYVILAVDAPSELQENSTIRFRFDRMYSLAIYNHINDEMISKGEKSLASKFLMLSRINRQNFTFSKKQFSKLDTILDCGSMPIYESRKDIKFKYDDSIYAYNEETELKNKLLFFNKFVDLCSELNTKLIIVFSPNFSRHITSFEARMREVVGNRAAFMLYDTENDIYKDKTYYYDSAHLNRFGAEIFTVELIKFLKTKFNL